MSTILRICPLLVAAMLQAAPPQAGWTDLFNGKDFAGWKMWNPDSFTIEDGAIVAHGTPGLAYYDGPFRDHLFREFELTVDVMTRPGSNGGVFILTGYQEKGWPPTGFEVQVNNSYVRDPVKTGSLYHVKDVNEAPARDNEWFTQHIVVKGDTITISVNDQQMVQWQQPADWAGTRDFAGRKIGPGTIALQAHDPNSTVYYKNIRIKPLD